MTEEVLTRFAIDLGEYEAKIKTALGGMEGYDQAAKDAQETNKGFSGSVGSAAQNFSALKTASSEAAKGVVDYAKAAAAANEQGKKLSDQIRAQEKAIYEMGKRLEEIKKTLTTGTIDPKTFKTLTAEAEHLTQALKDGNAALKGLKIDKKELDAAARSFSALAKEGKEVGDGAKVLSSELDSAFPIFGKVSAGAKVLKDGLSATVSSIVSGARTTAVAITTALGPVGIVIAAVVAGFALLAKVFFGTEKGSEALGKVLEPLKAIFQTLLGAVQKVSIALFDAFSNPKQAVKDLWEALKTNIVNRIKGLADTFVGLGKIIKGVFTLDTDLISEGVNQFAESSVQALTGVDDLAGKVTRGMKSMGDAIVDAAKKGARLAEIKEELEDVAIEIAENEGRINRAFQEQLAIASDVNLSAAERKKAAEEAIRLQQEMTALRLKELDLQIEQMKIEQSMNDTSDAERLELAKLIAAREQAVADELSATRRVRNTINAINKEAADKAIAEAKRVEEESKKLAEQRLTAAKEAGTILAEAEEQNTLNALDGSARILKEVELRYDKEVEAAKNAFAKLKQLTPEGEREAVAQKEAQALAAIEANRISTVTALREKEAEEIRKRSEEDIELLEETLKTKEQLEIEAVEKRFERLEEVAVQTIEDETALTETLAELQRQREEQLATIRAEAAEADLQRFYEENAARVEIMNGVADELSGVISQMAEGQIESAEEVGKALIAIALSTLEKIILMAVAENMAKRIAEKGLIGLAEGLALTVLIKGLFAAVKSKVAGAYEGERIVSDRGGKRMWSGRDGYLRRVHEGEGILDAETNRKYLYWLDTMRKGTFESTLQQRIEQARPMRHERSHSAILKMPDIARWVSTATHVNNMVHRAGTTEVNFSDRGIVGAIGESVRHEREQTELLRMLVRQRKMNKRYK